MTTFAEYSQMHSTIKLERHEGVVTMTLHTGGGPFIFDEPTHHVLATVFDALADDLDNRALILTGTGDRFCTEVNPESFAVNRRQDPDRSWMRLRRDGDRMLRAFVDLPFPVVAAINGPVSTHSELPLLADVVLAADTTTFRDGSHILQGIPPTDGMHVVWMALLGPNRGRHFLMTGATIDADRAVDLGFVSEVLATEELMPRAREISQMWAALPQWTSRNTRAVLVKQWRRELALELDTGLVNEAMASLRSPSMLDQSISASNGERD